MWYLNESHGLPLAFYLYNKHKSLEKLRQQLVFTNHTPEQGGNPQTDILLLEKMGFFAEIPITEVRAITGTGKELLDHTLAALRLSGRANGVSKLHRQTLLNMWKGYENICPILSITNAESLYTMLEKEIVPLYYNYPSR